MRSIPFVLWDSKTNLSTVIGLLTLMPAISHAVELTAPEITAEDEYVFNDALFKGSIANQKALIRLSEGGNIVPGTYHVDVYVNKQFIEKASIRFEETENHKVQPCFSLEFMERASVIIKPQDINLSNEKDHCTTLDHFVDQSTANFDMGRLRLDLSIPQSFIKQIPRGYVQPELLDEGESIGFVNYIANYYHSQFNANDDTFKQDSTYIGLNGGINLGKWQFRQQSSVTISDNGTEWNSIRSYVKRPIASLQSELSAGQLFTSGRFFSGLSYNGFNVSTDDRMLPESMRGYAPVVQGVAQTTAKVSISQGGNEIYQTTVSPGPFTINDLYPTNYNGDLVVTVTEADGAISQFRVPFSAVPDSVRKGAFKYNFDIGRTRDIGEDTNFVNLISQYGLNNAITLNSGLRFAEDYQSAVVGSAYTTAIGAFSGEATFSRAKLPEEGYIKGWMFGANYSKTFEPTNTTVALAGYRFSTEGYRDLSDVISVRQSVKDGYIYQSNTYKEKSRATIILNQSFNKLGTLYLSGSASSYRDQKPDDYQIQLGYGKTFSNGLSLNLSIARQMVASQQVIDGHMPDDFTQDKHDTTYGLALTFPLHQRKYAKNVRVNVTSNKDYNSYQTSVNGDVPYLDNAQYNAGVSYDDQSNISVWNAGLTKKFNNLNTSMNASKSKNYWQTSMSGQGSVALHSGGVTFGPYLGDTFALIEAKGAEGAHVLSGENIKINKQGYALVPSLSPYRYNTVALNPEGMSSHTELESGDVKIAPYSGSSVKVKFKTRQGYPILIRSSLSSGQFVPFGSDVLNENSESLGIAGQNGQIYVRADKEEGRLNVIWGDEKEDSCFINYKIPSDQLNQPLVRLDAICQIEK
ncbi:fimbrial protein [Acinetobacter equi]|uniref:Fimbrial protein n=2 Tax=Acinetobacter equi TaxID=1324350 RepID=A0A0N9W4E9_9GAMM|nr:fimbrial protein [Acinetobacter equi]